MDDDEAALVEVQSRIGGAATIADIYRVAAETGGRVFDCDACELLVEEGGSVDLAERFVPDGIDPPPGGATSPAIATHTYRSGEPMLIDDTHRDDRVDTDTDYRSILSVPLLPHAVIQFLDRDPNAFDDRTLALAAVFGGYVAHELDLRVSERQATAGDVLSAESTERLFDLVDVLVVAIDNEGRITFVNRQARETLGYEEGALVDRDWFDTCLPEPRRDEVRGVFERVMAGELDSVGRYENAIVTAEGDERIVEWYNTVLRDADGTITGTLSCGLDVTDREERERELTAAWRRYRTLLQAAPNPIFVADAETGEIVEVNEAAAEFRGQAREEIVGLHQTDLHPEEETEHYRDLFERHVSEGGTKRRLPDGSPIYAVTADGDRVPVEISVEMVELEVETVIYGVFRDISDQLAYEQALTGINEAARDLFEGKLPSEVADVTVETVTEILDPTGAVVYLADEGAGTLRPAAYGPPKATDLIGEPPVFEPADSIAWRVFVDGETAVFDDVREAEGVYNPETPIRSEIIVPLGEYGVLLVGHTETAAFDDRAVELAEILGATAEVALEHAEHERHIEDQTRQLKQRAQQLERVESINTRIRDVARAVVQSTTRGEVERTVCAELVEDDAFALAWIGAIDPVDDRLDVRAWAGDAQEYLDRVPLSLDDANAEPAVRTALSKEPTVVRNTATNVTKEAWRSEAVRRDFRSVASVPLVYQHSLQGVLTIYATTQSAFSGVLQSVLTELGDLLAHAITAIERKQTLLTNQAIELDFEILDRGCLFLRFTQETGCALDVEAIVPQSDDSWLVFVRVQNGAADQLLDAAEAATALASARLIDPADESLVQLRFVEPFIASVLADQGIAVRDISADGDACRVTVAVPPTFDIRRAIDVVSTTYPDSELVAKREHTPSADVSKSLTLRGLEKLTPRQREVLEVAYHRGYFDSPKKASGEELAAEFGFSPSAFHRHIRAAERKLFDTVFRNETAVSREYGDGPGG
ncbi:PAS domain S-box protein [Haloplanus rubicundus]|uniref:PAS domain S-box protein n=1 Tax=Haloplanus rubicundus TaxID=1547898 RepID=A0A345E3R2_9EURY|nr:GAF domain-containing protein [Haloplanus rubicundus]AXG06834.1 PAS domain S-box protein [Haloplanus rubicundus]